MKITQQFRQCSKFTEEKLIWAHIPKEKKIRIISLSHKYTVLALKDHIKLVWWDSKFFIFHNFTSSMLKFACNIIFPLTVSPANSAMCQVGFLLSHTSPTELKFLPAKCVWSHYVSFQSVSCKERKCFQWLHLDCRTMGDLCLWIYPLASWRQARRFKTLHCTPYLQHICFFF